MELTMSQTNNETVAQNSASVEANNATALTAEQKAENAAVEKELRAKQEKEFKERQASYLVDIVATYGQYEQDRSKALLGLARKMHDYVDSAMRFASEKNKAKAWSAAQKDIETALECHTDETIGVSRLLGVYGIALLLDDKEMVANITVSKLKVILKLIARDADAPGLAYKWATDANGEDVYGKAIALIGEVAAGKHTVVELGELRDKILAGDAKKEKPADAPASNSAGSNGGTKTPVKKAVSVVAKGLRQVKGDKKQMAETVQQLVKQKLLGTRDIIAAVQFWSQSGEMEKVERIKDACILLIKRSTAAAAK